MGHNLLGLRATSAFLMVTLMSGCVSGLPEVSRFKAADLDTQAVQKREKEAAESLVISALQARQSVLPSGSAFERGKGSGGVACHFCASGAPKRFAQRQRI